MTGTLTVIFKPTALCNLRCRYCYAARERDVFHGTMDRVEADAAFDFVRRYCERLGIHDVSVIWHGGEPLLMGTEFIRRTVERYTEALGAAGIHTTNKIQTNLTLATESFIPLFRDHFKSRVGFSLDYQSGCRLLPDGRDATDTIVERALALRASGIETLAIAMMSANNIGRIRELYDWFKGLGIPFRLNRIFATSSEKTAGMAGTVTAEQYAQAVCDLIDIWLADPQPADCGTAAGTVSSFLRGESKLCSIDGRCSASFLGIAAGGVLLPCGRFDSDAYAIGDFRTDTVDQVLERKREVARLGEIRPDQHKCAACPWNPLCVAGCLHSRLFGWFEQECTTNRIVWEHVARRLAEFGLSRGTLADLPPEHAEALLKPLARSNQRDFGN